MKKTVYIFGCLILLIFSACQKEMSDDFNTYTNHPFNDTVWLRTVPSTATVNELMSNLLPQIVIDSFNVDKDTTLSYGDSLSVSFTAGSCVGNVANGGTAGPATGKVKMELIRLKKKGDYIKAFKATTSNGYLLETGGAFFVRLSKDGKELALAPGATFKIRFSDVDDPKINMQRFYGKETNPYPAISIIDTSFNWVRDADTSWLTTFQKQNANNVTVKGYELVAKNLRWIAAEHFVDSTAAKTKITAVLPPNYTNKTTAVFAVFINQKTIVSLGPDYASRSYAANNIPIGSKIRLLSFSKIGSDFYMGIKDINDVGRVTSYSITPTKTTLVDILTYLNTL